MTWPRSFQEYPQESENYLIQYLSLVLAIANIKNMLYLFENGIKKFIKFVTTPVILKFFSIKHHLIDTLYNSVCTYQKKVDLSAAKPALNIVLNLNTILMQSGLSS